MTKCNKAKLGVSLGQSFLCPSNAHVKNEKLHAFRGCETIDVQVVNGDETKKEKKYQQFVAIFHFLQQGCLMINLEDFKRLF